MSVIEILSGAVAKRTKAEALFLSLLMLVWRASDLLEEVITGTPKMSIGKWHITGTDAVVVQIVIIGFLGCICFIAYCHMHQDVTPE
ncbi:MAG: hypothetical protein ACI9A2_004422 [Halioglobus sp.]|jgi:hypothetical protein